MVLPAYGSPYGTWKLQALHVLVTSEVLGDVCCEYELH